jgi:hypothetical protein
VMFDIADSVREMVAAGLARSHTLDDGRILFLLLDTGAVFLADEKQIEKLDPYASATEQAVR